MISESEIEAANQALSGKDPQEIIRWAVGLGGKCVVSTNFNPYEPAILHMIHEIQPDMEVLWVDLGFNTKETYLFAEDLISRLSLNIHRFIPQRTSAHIEAVFGGIPAVEDKEQHDAFTQEVKIEPFQRGLKTLAPDVWLTALRRDQTDHRAAMPIITKDPGMPLKVCPLLDWDEAQVGAYIEAQGLPIEHHYHDPTKVFHKRECGLHVQNLAKDA